MHLVPEDRFEQLVSEGLDLVPAELAARIENVAVVVADAPTSSQQGSRGGLLLGLYEGIPLSERSDWSYQGVMPDRITIFRRALCQVARDEDDLRRQVTVTVVHEVAHHFGIGDARLHELGWG